MYPVYGPDGKQIPDAMTDAKGNKFKKGEDGRLYTITGQGLTPEQIAEIERARLGGRAGVKNPEDMTDKELQEARFVFEEELSRRKSKGAAEGKGNTNDPYAGIRGAPGIALPGAETNPAPKDEKKEENEEEEIVYYYEGN
jgi:hypothetical protein